MEQARSHASRAEEKHYEKTRLHRPQVVAKNSLTVRDRTGRFSSVVQAASTTVGQQLQTTEVRVNRNRQACVR